MLEPPTRSRRVPSHFARLINIRPNVFGAVGDIHSATLTAADH